MRQRIEKFEQFVFSVEDGDDDGDCWIQVERLINVILKRISKIWKKVLI